MNRKDHGLEAAFRSPDKRRRCRGIGGVLLLEIIVVVAIIGYMFAARNHNTGEEIVNARNAIEDRALDELAASIKQTLMSTDLTNVNIAAIAGEIGPTDTATQFTTNSRPVYTTCASNDWFVKLANFRGVPVTTGVAPTPTVQPQLARILYNSYGQPRMLFIRQTVQSDKIQLLLVSLMSPTSGALVMPTYQLADAWFDAIAGYNFDNRKLPIPAYWVSQNLLTASQQLAWNNAQGDSNINRLRVVLITVHKWTVNVNNNSSSYYGWVYWNNGGGRYEAAPGSGATSTPAIIEGRTFTCATGLVESSAVQNYNPPLQGTGSFSVK